MNVTSKAFPSLKSFTTKSTQSCNKCWLSALEAQRSLKHLPILWVKPEHHFLLCPCKIAFCTGLAHPMTGIGNIQMLELAFLRQFEWIPCAWCWVNQSLIPTWYWFQEIKRMLMQPSWSYMVGRVYKKRAQLQQRTPGRLNHLCMMVLTMQLWIWAVMWLWLLAVCHHQSYLHHPYQHPCSCHDLLFTLAIQCHVEQLRYLHRYCFFSFCHCFHWFQAQVLKLYLCLIRWQVVCNFIVGWITCLWCPCGLWCICTLARTRPITCRMNEALHLWHVVHMLHYPATTMGRPSSFWIHRYEGISHCYNLFSFSCLVSYLSSHCPYFCFAPQYEEVDHYLLAFASPSSPCSFCSSTVSSYRTILSSDYFSRSSHVSPWKGPWQS